MSGMPSLIIILTLGASLCAVEPGGTGAGLRPLGRGGLVPAEPKAPAAKPTAEIRGYEPWVKTASIGDFLVKRYPDGRISRQEVIAMTADAITVAFSDPQKGTQFGELRYRRQPGTGKAAGKQGHASSMPEPELKQQSTKKVDLGGRSVTCVVYAGQRCSTVLSDNRQQYEVWGAFERQIAPEVPFGGVIKELYAKSKAVAITHGKVQGWQQAPGAGGAIRLLNPDPPTETSFEVIDFGIGKAGGK